MGQGYRFQAKGKKNAEIFIYEDIGSDWMGGISAAQFAADLKSLGPLDTIDLRINSHGGEVFDGLAIYQQLVNHPARVTSYVDGVAASIASVIAMAGDEIRIAEAGFFMIHNAFTMARGDARKMREIADQLETVSGAIADVYVARTGKPVDKIKEWMNAETWFTAKNAVDEGFAAAIMPNLRAVARYTPGLHNFANVPTGLDREMPARPARDSAAAVLQHMRQRMPAAPLGA